MKAVRAGERLDDRAIIRQQLRDARRSLRRPGVYLGAAKELALSAFHLAAYPFGVTPSSLPPEPLPLPRGATVHPRLEEDPDAAAVPIVLVHGFVHNRSAFLWMTRALRRAGFRNVHGLNYNPMKQDVAEIARMLAEEVDRVLAVTGAKRCMVVGHSMGGIVARYYVQALGGHRCVDTVITLGTPHRGTYTAHLGWGAAAPQLRKGTAVMRTLEETARPSAVRWISYYCDLDLMITPAVSGKLVHPALRATNIRVRDTGHLSLLLSGDALGSIVDHLADRELGWNGDTPRPLPSDTPTSVRFRARRNGARIRAVPERHAAGGQQ